MKGNIVRIMHLTQTRRRVLTACAAGAVSCIGDRRKRVNAIAGTSSREGRVAARPRTPVADGAAGLHTVAIGARRKPLLYVPARWRREDAGRLIVSLHGAGGEAQGGLDLLREFADEYGFLLLAPASHESTWDVIVSSFGRDVEMLDAALAWTFDRYTITGIAIAGFSDGASYALSLGVTNGDLFSHGLAFSPGFVTAVTHKGDPVLFVSHGTEDRILPIARCSRSLVPRLRRAGYKVTYEEFHGGHSAPPELRRAAVELFLGG